MTLLVRMVVTGFAGVQSYPQGAGGAMFSASSPGNLDVSLSDAAWLAQQPQCIPVCFVGNTSDRPPPPPAGGFANNPLGLRIMFDKTISKFVAPDNGGTYRDVATGLAA